MAKRTDNVKELRNLNEADLGRRLTELREKERKLSFRTRSDEIRDVHEFRKTKREIARILTIITEKSNINGR